MAKMTFRETNMANWVGCRPGHNGEQVRVMNSVAGAALTIYTVPAGKVFSLCTAVVCCDCHTAGAGDAYSRILTSAPSEYFRLAQFRFVGNESQNVVVTFWPPMECAAGDYFVIFSGQANLDMRLSIFGWVEDA